MGVSRSTFKEPVAARREIIGLNFHSAAVKRTRCEVKKEQIASINSNQGSILSKKTFFVGFFFCEKARDWIVFFLKRKKRVNCHGLH